MRPSVCLSVFVQVRSLDNQLHPERLKVITQQVEEEQAILQSQTLLRLQQIHAADRRTHSPQVRRTRKLSHSRALSVLCPLSNYIICTCRQMVVKIAEKSVLKNGGSLLSISISLMFGKHERAFDVCVCV